MRKINCKALLVSFNGFCFGKTFYAKSFVKEKEFVQSKSAYVSCSKYYKSENKIGAISL